MILTVQSKALATCKAADGITNHWVFCWSVAEHQSVKCNSLEFDSFIPWWWQNKYHLHSMTELKLTIFLFYLLIQPFGHSWSWQYAGCLTLYDLVKAYFTFVFSVTKLEGLRFYWLWRLWSFVCLMPMKKWTLFLLPYMYIIGLNDSR